ncbi:C40 family peptidase [Poseidonibacter lekithochrous]|uniref:C40 family peptidase n=1 Tax=Poseidonibacter lekithochrous TaxID=1904463 RepID=UPI000D3A249B|nr:SH3 domain-containing C40 family peptidase [Poseidonibacter lekithochrous]
MRNNKLFIYLTILIISLFFNACTSSISNITIKDKKLSDLNYRANDNFMNQKKEASKFLDKYFRPWNQEEMISSMDDATWGFKYRLKDIYLENHNKASQSWFSKQIDNSNFQKYNQVLKKAISIRNTNVRVFPTKSVMFLNPNKQGEGFPFDYNQNSLLKINSPILISHFSKDKAWAYMQASSFAGWVSINDIAFVNDDFIKEFQTNSYEIAIKEKFALYDRIFREFIKVGTLFPKKDGKYLIARADYNQNALISEVSIKKENISKFPIVFNTENRIKIARALMNEPYGWGGLMNNRDCSSFTRDFFAPFGKYLKRNSKAQTDNGKVYDISKLSNKEKQEYIKQKAIAFSTLIYLKGHIMLYVGVKDNEPLVMHNIWSIRLKNNEGKEYRHIIGKTSITTLEPAREQKDFNPQKSLLSKIQAIVIL